MKKIECEILGISSSPATGGAYALLLKEVWGNRRLPIIIGHWEAQAIAVVLEGMKPPRPLTHDLIKAVIDNLGAVVKEILITELRDNTFYANVIIEIATLTNEIDARPSDAIALAIRANAPIYVSETVMDTASFLPSADSPSFINDTEADEEMQEPPEPPPPSKEAKLAAMQERLRQALEVEDYERAAKLRDEIKRFSGSN